MRNLQPWETTKLNDLQVRQISEEIALCVNAGVNSWQILKALRSLRLESALMPPKTDNESN